MLHKKFKHTIHCKAIIAILFILAILHPSIVCGDKPPLALIEDHGTATLSQDDCPKCHNEIVNKINISGAAHGEKVTCLDCHDGHPPAKRDIIPSCGKCHQDNSHFNLKDCTACHTNPHAPLDISLTRNITYACTTCHDLQIKQLKENPSIHTTFDCTACHAKHGFIPECFACHAPHQDNMTNQDCLKCHRAHMPLVVLYSSDTPSDFCGSCHADVYSQTGKSRAKHRFVSCVKCHEAKHKMIPTCQKCHGTPHPQGMLENFKGCGVCHGIAHFLRLNEIDMILD